MPRFDVCPPDFSAKCVTSLAERGPTAMDPIPFSCSADEAFAAVRAVVDGYPRTEITEEADGRYLDSIFRTRVFRWKDRVQFEVDEDAGVIHFKSYSTPTYAGSDLGANRKRMTELVELLRPRLG